MKDDCMPLPLLPQNGALWQALDKTDSLAARYGLTMTHEDRQMLAQAQRTALQATGRVEFGEGPYRGLIAALCDSPYLSQATYAETLAALCELFYSMKSESGERWSDDELIGAIAELFDGVCQGSTELVGDRLWQALHGDSVGDDESDGEEGPFGD